MKRIFNYAAVALVATLFITACGKYEEGPKLSLRSKKARVANTWKIAGGTVSITDSTGNTTSSDVEPDEDYSITIEKDGTWKDSDDDSGTWEFSDDKEKLKMTYEEDGVSTTFESEILKLKNDEMWLKDEVDFFGAKWEITTQYETK